MTKAERLELQANKLVEMKQPENELRAKGKRFIAGIDEVGRGPLAGPVYTACVVLPEDFDVLGVNDSKKLSPKKREELSAIIKEKAVAYGIGIADNHEIDDINILEATKVAMTRAITNCNAALAEKFGDDATIDHLLVDALKLPVDIEQDAIIKGDEKCLCIAAASIVAKVARDNFMVEMDEQYPGYDFAGNKGYGTAAHYEGLRELGYTPIHRRSFLKKFEEEQAGERTAAWGDAKMAKKVYAVRKGRTTGIFTDWDTCKAQVEGFPGAEYKGFQDVNEAHDYLCNSRPSSLLQIQGTLAYVDGSFDASSGRYSCGVVILQEGSEAVEISQAFEDADAATHRNVAGEVMGSTLAVKYCQDNGIKEVTIFHDYEGIAKWANNDWKANHKLTQDYKLFIAEARKSMKIDFVKVKAHTGNKYNEIADKLAKKALGI